MVVVVGLLVVYEVVMVLVFVVVIVCVGFCSGIAGKGCPSRLTHNTFYARLDHNSPLPGVFFWCL